jgi:hypothetical protein
MWHIKALYLQALEWPWMWGSHVTYIKAIYLQALDWPWMWGPHVTYQSTMLTSIRLTLNVRTSCDISTLRLDDPKWSLWNFCFSAKHAALWRKSKDWLARNEDNVSEWGDIFTHGLLFQWASTIKIWKLTSSQLDHGEKKLIFNEMMMRSALYWTNALSFIFIVLAHWNNSPWVNMSPHSDTLSSFRANQSLLFLHNDHLIRGVVLFRCLSNECVIPSFILVARKFR